MGSLNKTFRKEEMVPTFYNMFQKTEEYFLTHSMMPASL